MSILEIQDKLEKGEFVFQMLLPSLIRSLDNSFKHLEKNYVSMPLFIKTMTYYKLLEPSIFTDLNQENVTLDIVQKNSHYIQQNLEVIKISSASNYLNETILQNESLEMLNLSICEVKNSTFRGASHPHFLGLIFMNTQAFENRNEFLLSISHELAHQELFLLNMVDRLVTTSNSNRLIHSPLQGRERPTIGRLHSAHALFRMIQHEKLYPNGKIEKFKDYLNRTIGTFEKNELTDFSYFLLKIYRNEVDQ